MIIIIILLLYLIQNNNLLLVICQRLKVGTDPGPGSSSHLILVERTQKTSDRVFRKLNVFCHLNLWKVRTNSNTIPTTQG